MSKQRGNLIIIAIIIGVVLILGVVGYVIWQQLQPKAATPQSPQVDTSQADADSDKEVEMVDPYIGWKTYTSERDGYSIQYPSDWIVISETTHDGPYIRNMQFTGGSYPEGYINLRILRDEGTVSGSTLSPEDWYKKLGVETVQKGPVTFTPDTVEDYTLNNLEVKKAKSVFSEIDEDVFILHGSVLYEINMYPYGVSGDPTVNLMLKSFRLK